MAKSETSLQELKEFSQGLMKSFASIFAAITHHSERFSELFDGEMSDDLLENDVMSLFDSLKNVLDNAENVISVSSSQVERFKSCFEKNELSLSKPSNVSPPKQCVPSPDGSTGRKYGRRSKIHDTSLAKVKKETPLESGRGVSRCKTTSQVDNNEVMEEEPSTSGRRVSRRKTIFQVDTDEEMKEKPSTSGRAASRCKITSQVDNNRVMEEELSTSTEDLYKLDSTTQFDATEVMEKEPSLSSGRQYGRRFKCHDTSLAKVKRGAPLRGGRGVSRRKTISQIHTSEVIMDEPSTSTEDLHKLHTTFQFDATEVMEKEPSLNIGASRKRRSQLFESSQAKIRRETPAKSVKDLRKRKTISQFGMFEEMKQELLTRSNDDDEHDETFTDWQMLFPLPNDVPETSGVYEIKVPSAKRPCFVGHCSNLKASLSDHINAKKVVFKQLDTFISRNLSKLEFHYQITSSSFSAKEISDARLNSIEQSTGSIPFYNKLI